MTGRIRSSTSTSITAAVVITALLLWAERGAGAPTRPPLATGADFDTSAYGITLHVKPGGSDANDGLSHATALRTIGKAFDLAKTWLAQGIGVKVLIHPGRYREPTIRLDASAMTQAAKEAVFIVEGAEKGTVVVSGSDRDGWEVPTWKRVFPDSFIYTHSWNFLWFYDCGTVPPTADGCLGSRREMVVINGRILRQVVRLSAQAINTFYIDEAAKTIRIKLNKELTSSDLVEIPNQMFLFRCSGKNNVALRKIIFEHENSYINSGLNDGDGWGVAVGFRSTTRTHNLLIEDCEFRSCNACALKLYNYDKVTIRRCKANGNGWKGIGFGNGSNILVEDSETSYNAWRQNWTHTVGHDAAGIKVISDAKLVTIRRHYCDSNTTASGIWLDWQNSNVTIDNCVFNNHLFQALYVECTSGPTVITRCKVQRSPSGIFFYGASNNIVEDCWFENVGEIFSLLVDLNRAPTCASNVNFYVRRCYFNGRGPHFGSGDWMNFFNTLDIDSNRYWNTQGTATSRLFKDGAGTPVTFAQWQALGKDVHSIWLDSAVSTRRDLKVSRSAACGRLVRIWAVALRFASLQLSNEILIVDIRGKTIATPSAGKLPERCGHCVVMLQIAPRNGHNAAPFGAESKR